MKDVIYMTLIQSNRFFILFFIRLFLYIMTVIGIDLGTTYSCSSYYKNNKINIIPNDLGKRVTPSYIMFEEDNIIVGEMAKNAAKSGKDHKNIVYDIKRLMGKSYDDPLLQNDLKHFTFDVINIDNKPHVSIESINKIYSPIELSSFILKHIKKYSEDFIGDQVTKAVITVPAYFNNQQRSDTFAAGQMAGLEVLRIINEPTSASIAYGYNDSDCEKNILIYDLGGGTFDVSLLNIDSGIFKVIGTHGDPHLGGEDFDNELVKFCLKEFSRKNRGINIKELVTNKKVLQKLKMECEKTKTILSSLKETYITVESLYQGIDFHMKISRVKFENLCMKYFNKTLSIFQEVLTNSGLNNEDISDVILIGGSTRIPMIKNMISRYFGYSPRNDINPDETVACGAGIQGSLICGELNKDSDLIFIDITPMSLGIKTSNGIMKNIIDKNTTIPCTKEEIFTTHSDNQPSIGIKIYEGERKLVKNNNLLGSFDLSGIPLMPRGLARIHVIFRLDSNGILNVSAKEESSGKSNELIIKYDKDKEINDKDNDKDSDDNIDNLVLVNEFEDYVFNLSKMINNMEIRDNLTEKQIKEISDIIIESIKRIRKKVITEEYINNIKRCILDILGIA